MTIQKQAHKFIEFITNEVYFNFFIKAIKF